MEFIQEITYLEWKVEHMSEILMTNKVKKHIGFHYLLTETHLPTSCFDLFGIEYISQDVLSKINGLKTTGLKRSWYFNNQGANEN